VAIPCFTVKVVFMLDVGYLIVGLRLGLSRNTAVFLVTSLTNQSQLPTFSFSTDKSLFYFISD